MLQFKNNRNNNNNTTTTTNKKITDINLMAAGENGSLRTVTRDKSGVRNEGTKQTKV